MVKSKKKIKKIAFLSLVLLGLALVILAIFVHYHQVIGVDVFLSKDLQAEGDTPEKKTFIYHLLYIVSLFGKPLISSITISLFAIFFWAYRYYRETVFIVLTSLSVLINSIIKIIVNRPRPTANFVQILAIEKDQSFPSGHVNFYTVFFGFLLVALFFTPKIPRALRFIIQFVCLFLIVTVSFSRVYLGAHWVTDTIGGYFLGLITLGIILKFYLKNKL